MFTKEFRVWAIHSIVVYTRSTYKIKLETVRTQVRLGIQGTPGRLDAEKNSYSSSRQRTYRCKQGTHKTNISDNTKTRSYDLIRKVEDKKGQKGVQIVAGHRGQIQTVYDTYQAARTC